MNLDKEFWRKLLCMLFIFAFVTTDVELTRIFLKYFSDPVMYMGFIKYMEIDYQSLWYFYMFLGIKSLLLLSFSIYIGQKLQKD